MKVIILNKNNIVNILESKGILFNTFEEEYKKWLKTVKKSKLNTHEIFSLKYDSLLSDLTNSIFVEITSDETLNYLSDNFNIIEYE